MMAMGPLRVGKLSLFDPRLKYVGLSLVLTWHYCLWFVPKAFPWAQLLDTRVTYSWLLALFSFGVTCAVQVFRAAPTGHLRLTPGTILATGVISSGATTLVECAGISWIPLWITWISAAVVGVSGAMLWVWWGECLYQQNSHFTLRHVGIIHGTVMLGGVGTVSLLSPWAAAGVTALIPLACSMLLNGWVRRLPVAPPPRKLPAEIASQGNRARLTVLAISFLASFACYYTVAIVPWSAFDDISPAYGQGVLLGAALLLALALLHQYAWPANSEFRIYPWLLWFVIVACLLCLADQRGQAPAFLVAVAVTSLFEIFLTMYTGVLAWRGYTTGVSAFGLSGAAIRLGIAGGDATAIAYEHLPRWHDVLVAPTFAVMVAGLVGALMTLVRQEYVIEELTRKPQTLSERDILVNQIAEEFKLSAREREVMMLLGHGYTACAAAEKLVLSPHTVNTHIQHLYAKLGIHKRSQLIAYLDKPMDDHS